MTGLAVFRIVLGAASWLAPGPIARSYGVPSDHVTAELEYMTRAFGVRAVALGVGYLASSGTGGSCSSGCGCYATRPTR